MGYIITGVVSFLLGVVICATITNTIHIGISQKITQNLKDDDENR